jgi:hypothetical protein
MIATDDVVGVVASHMKGNIIVLVHEEFFDRLRAQRVIRERVRHNRRTSHSIRPRPPLAVDHDLGVFAQASVKPLPRVLNLEVGEAQRHRD